MRLNENGSRSPLVLVVDDEATTRVLARAALVSSGCEVQEADSGSSALERASATRPDLVLLDLVMPGMDGFAVCAGLRRDPNLASMPILVLTAMDDSDTINRAFEVGATDFIGKPVNPTLLVQRVRFALRSCEMAAELRRSQARLALTQRVARVSYWEYDPEAGSVRWSEEGSEILGLAPPAAGVGIEEFLACLHPADRDRFRRGLEEALALDTPFLDEPRVLLENGAEHHLYARGEIQHDRQSKRRMVVGSLQDITELRRLEQRLDYLLNYDTITGLPNRALLRDRLRQTTLANTRRGTQAAVVVLDLDNFKTINETVGPEQGDALLRAVAQRFSAELRGSDTLARLGGNEFALVVSELGQEADSARLTRRVLGLLEEPFRIGSQEVFVNASAGIALHPIDGADPETLLRNAEVAMYSAKAAGGSTYRYFTADMDSRAADRLALETDLRKALERREFILYYQPLLEVASGRVAGVEALLRWQHPERGLVLPGEFIPLLEETGLIGPVGCWVVRQACAQLRQWRDQGIDARCMRVNLSGRQFVEGDLIDLVGGALTESNLEPDALELEITENLIMRDTPAATTALSALEALGLSLAVDDFGTGYSSLAYLKRLPVSVLKIDRSFVSDMAADMENAVIVQSTISLAHNLGLSVVAEGVEDAEVLAMLHEMGCDLAQGFFFSRPLPAQQCAAWIRERAPQCPGPATPQ